MNNGDGFIKIFLNLDDKDFYTKLNDLEGKTSNFGQKIGVMLGALGIAKLGKDFLSAGINYNMAMENYTAGLTTLLGSTEKAEKMIADLKDYAAKTPFEMSDLASATQTLLSFGVEQKNVMGIMKQLGDISLGDQQKFQSLALVFGQVSSQGKLMGQDLLQMINAGFNPLQIISEKTGESMASLKEKMSKGQIGIKEVEQAFKWATEEGGKFYGGMDRGSKTLSGQISTLKDNFNSFAGEAIKPLVDFAKDNLVPALIEIFENSDQIYASLNKLMPVIVSITAGLVAFKGALLISSLVYKLSLALKVAFLTLSNLGIGGTIKMLMGFANPVTLVIAGIAALVAGFLYLWNTSEDFRNFWIGLWKNISDFFVGTWNTIIGFFTETIPEVWAQFLENLALVKDTIIQVFTDAWNGVISFFTETIPGWIESVIELFNKLPYFIGYAIGAVIATLANFGLWLINFVTVDIPNFITSVGDWFSKLPGIIWQWLLETLTNIGEWGNNIYTTSTSWVSKTINGIVSYFSALPGKIWTWLASAYNRVITWGSDLWDAGKKAASQLIDSVIGGIKSLPGKFYDIGSNMVKGLWNGIASVEDWIMDKVGGFFGSIVDGIRDFFGIHSPSTLMRDAIGKFLPPGIAIGFKLALPKSAKDISSELDGMTSDIKRKVDINMNDINTSATLESNAKLSVNKEIVGSFPKTMKMEGNQNVYLVAEDGTELAHWIAPFMDKELKFG